jgi:tRNA threonylcarbamoyl adenosine modification protein YeaZ
VLVLVVDASSAAVTVGVVDVPPDAPAEPRAALASVRTLAQRITVDARAHAELLAVSTRDALAEAGAAMADLSAVVTGVGPGPYTGLRVGIVTAAAFADALGIPAYGVCSLDGIGLAAAAATGSSAGDPAGDSPGDGRLLVAADARRREVYWAVYDQGVRIGDPQVHRPADVPEQLAGGAGAMAGAGARQYADLLALPLLGVDFPQVDALVAMAVERLAAQAPNDSLAPMYLRKPDAQEPTGPAKSTLGP